MPETHADIGAMNEETVRALAHTMHIDLSNEEVTTLNRELVAVLEDVVQLAEVADDIPPTSHANPQLNVMRADEVRDVLSREEALQNAPAVSEGMFKVTSIMGGEQ